MTLTSAISQKPSYNVATAVHLLIKRLTQVHFGGVLVFMCESVNYVRVLVFFPLICSLSRESNYSEVRINISSEQFPAISTSRIFCRLSRTRDHLKAKIQLPLLSNTF